MLSLQARGKHDHEQRPQQAPALWAASVCGLIIDSLLVMQKPQGYNPSGTDFSGMSMKVLFWKGTNLLGTGGGGEMGKDKKRKQS